MRTGFESCAIRAPDPRAQVVRQGVPVFAASPPEVIVEVCGQSHHRAPWSTLRSVAVPGVQGYGDVSNNSASDEDAFMVLQSKRPPSLSHGSFGVLDKRRRQNRPIRADTVPVTTGQGLQDGRVRSVPGASRDRAEAARSPCRVVRVARRSM
jgi:hypothetical protein